MQQSIRESLYEESKRLDDLFYGLGDILDVKASIILVAVTFLGALSCQLLLEAHPPVVAIWLQVVSVATLFVSAVIIYRVIRPTRFLAPPTPQEWEPYISQWE